MKLYYSSAVQKWLFNMPYKIHKRIMDKLDFYINQPDPLVFAKYIGEKTYRFRVGNYRIIFIIEQDVAHVIKIEWRDKVYK